ncbi:MAG TPA: CoA transferase [Blastocatellia bacterium]|nr:CoA transferase [Blastocatellia bacterium]
MSEHQNLLSGLRVIDCGTYIAGPATAVMLSDFGAEVIKVERPGGGDPYRYLSFLPGMAVSEHNYCWLLDARNKRSLALDLRHPEGKSILRTLVAAADVFITNYPPDLAAKLQVRYEDIGSENPRLIYAHITGYGETGREAHRPAYDATAYWARSGLTNILFDLTTATAATPCGTGDHPVALALFGAIMLALYQRQLTGRGANVSTSLLATGAWSNSCQIQAALLAAEFPQRRTRFTTLNPLVNGYQSRDHRRFLLCCLDTARDWKRICAVIERTELIDDLRYSAPEARSERGEEIVALLDSAFATRDLEEWQRRFAEHDVIWGLIPTIDNVARDPQMHAAGIFAELDHPELGSVQTVNNPINFNGVTKEKPKLAPDVGQHSREILRELGYEDQAITKLIDRGVVAES